MRQSGRRLIPRHQQVCQQFVRIRQGGVGLEGRFQLPLRLVETAALCPRPLAKLYRVAASVGLSRSAVSK